MSDESGRGNSHKNEFNSFSPKYAQLNGVADIRAPKPIAQVFTPRQ
jgi:hypothetical protein